MDGQRTQQRHSVDWAGLGWMVLFFWYFSGVTQTLLQLSGSVGFSSFRQAFYTSLLWLIPVLMFPRQARRLAALIGVPLWLCSLVGFGYFLVYGQEFSQSVIFIMFESNVQEASEYLGHYFSWGIVLAVLVYGLGGWLLWRKIRPVYLPRTATWVSCTFLFALSIGYQAVAQISDNDTLSRGIDDFAKRIEPAMPWQLVVGYYQYQQQLGRMESMLASAESIPPLEDLQDARAGLPTTLVLVMGESTNRQRMSLYGYDRPTTPRLDARRDELEVFEQVVTPRPYTIEALQQILTFADQESPDRYLETPSLVKLMEQAGYKTFWITNQQTMTKRNTMLTTFSEQTDVQYYLNNSRDQNSRHYDESVLQPFEAVLADPAPRKFIMVHLLGAHMRYEYRYPDEFAYFSGRAGVPDTVADDQLATYNSYDNAVRYNDYVVDQLIDTYAAHDPDGFLLYLSDHGEAVFDADAPEVLGRNEAAPTEPMYTVPFMVWRSPRWRDHDETNYGRARWRAYSSSHFIHTWAELAGLDFQGWDSSKSLVSADFRERPVLIGDPGQPKGLIDFSLVGPLRKPTPRPNGQPLAQKMTVERPL